VLAGSGLALAFSAGMYFLSRRMVRPYAGLLRAVTTRFHADEGAGRAGLTSYLDALTAQLAAAPVHGTEKRLAPRARAGQHQPLEVVDMLALIAADASRLQHLLDEMPIGVIVFDGAQRVMYWNRRCEAILGWRADEVIGRTPAETYAGPLAAAVADDLAAQATGRERSCTVMREYRRRDGAIRHCSMTVSCEVEGDGQLVRVLTLMQDVTEQRVAEASEARFLHELSGLARQLIDQEAQVTRRLAQSLHDRLGQTLSALRLTFDALAMRADSSAQSWRVSRMSPLIDQAVAEVREALVELRPALLDDEGLVSALDHEVRSQARNPHRVKVTLASTFGAPLRFPAAVEFAAFMVAREAVGNALRHAAARSIEVRLAGEAGALRVEVRDDGGGFDARGVTPRPGHLGLVGMRERALAVGAELSIESVAGSGSRVGFCWMDSSAASLPVDADRPASPPRHEVREDLPQPPRTAAA
jgi:PAS domain S-box-containing protein